MRVLFATYSEKTHFLSAVPLAWALRAAGHEVRVASQPELTATITEAGLTAVPVGRDHTLWRSVDRLLTPRVKEFDPALYERTRRGQSPPFDLPADPADITAEYLRDADEGVVATAGMINGPMVDDLVAFARSWRPDLVVWEPATYAGAIAAASVGAAHARFVWGLDFAGALRGHVRAAQPGGDALAAWLGGYGERHGFAFTEDLAVGQVTLDHMPPSVSLGADVARLPLRFVPYGGPAVVPGWLWRPPERPRVALTLGISATERFDGYLVGVQEVLESLADLDVEVVATVADKERHRVAAVPGNARVVPYVPLHSLLPTCAAVIHHGGAGTVSTALLHGVPQVVVPDQADGQRAAGLLAGQGAALVVPPDGAGGGAVRDAVCRLLSEPAFGADARRLRAEVADLPTPAQVVPRLVAHAAAGSAAVR
ncbi:activator-dependent family glycosyltransferase [Actinosynnema sp. NPDC023587]|uniref:activator-dependent family glycosyltransferase n=1 Tax=Actinosynnema sp. NPDC023587 TaxID=3154695 RepID=UPI0034058E59